jgi:Tfp pilus assembly PilM family ATPase
MPRAAAIELTDADLKVVLATWSKGQALLIERALSVDLSDLPKDAAGMEMRLSRVRDRLKAAENLPQCDAGILLPKQYCIARTVKLPATAHEEIAGMVQFEAEKHIPFNREQHVVSHEVVEVTDAGSEVILCAAEEAVGRNGADFIAAGGFEPLFASVSSVALAQTFLSLMPPDATNSPVILLQLGQIHTDITILYKERIVATRAVMYGLATLRNQLMSGPTPFSTVDREVEEKILEEMKNFGVPVASGRRVSHDQIMRLDMNEPQSLMFDIDAAEDEESAVETGQFTDVGQAVRSWLHKLAGQIRRTCEYASREAQLPAPVRVHLSGEGALIRGMSEHLAGELGVEVVTFNPLAKLAAAPSLTKNEIERLPEFAGLYGTLMRLQERIDLRAAAPQRINLLPAEVIAKHLAQERNVLLTVTGTLGLIAAILCFLLYDASNRYEAARATRHAESIAAMEPLVSSLKEKERKVKIIQRLRTEHGSALAVLDVLSAYPDLGPELQGGKLTLTDFKFTAEDSMTVSGQALSIQEITSFVEYLQAQEVKGKKVFTAVTVRDQTPTSIPGRDGNVYNFSIIGELEKSSAKKR